MKIGWFVDQHLRQNLTCYFCTHLKKILLVFGGLGNYLLVSSWESASCGAGKGLEIYIVAGAHGGLDGLVAGGVRVSTGPS